MTTEVARNFLKGQVGDSINFMMAAAGFNFKKLMVKLQNDIFWLKNLLQSIFNKNHNKYQLFIFSRL